MALQWHYLIYMTMSSQYRSYRTCIYLIIGNTAWLNHTSLYTLFHSCLWLRLYILAIFDSILNETLSLLAQIDNHIVDNNNALFPHFLQLHFLTRPLMTAYKYPYRKNGIQNKFSHQNELSKKSFWPYKTTYHLRQQPH